MLVFGTVLTEAWLVGSSKFCRAELRCCVDQANLWVGGPLWGSWQLVASDDRRVNGAEADGKLMKQPEKSSPVSSPPPTLHSTAHQISYSALRSLLHTTGARQSGCLFTTD